MNEIHTIPAAGLRNAAAAEYLNKSPGWLAKMRADGRGPKFRRVGSAVFYTREALDEYLRGCEFETEDSRRIAAG